MTVEHVEEPLAELGLLREGEDPEGSRKRDDTYALDIEAARLRGKRLTYREIAERMGCHPSTAHARVQRAYKAARADATDVAREFERERLDQLYRRAEEVAEKTHYVTAHGKVVINPETNEPLIDPMPVLAAYKEMRQIAESYRKLEGLDQPTKVEQTGTVKYEVVGVDPTDLA
jgi:DNA-binding Lrp family transcriptional regulator